MAVQPGSFVGSTFGERRDDTKRASGVLARHRRCTTRRRVVITLCTSCRYVGISGCEPPGVQHRPTGVVQLGSAWLPAPPAAGEYQHGCPPCHKIQIHTPSVSSENGVGMQSRYIVQHSPTGEAPLGLGSLEVLLLLCVLTSGARDSRDVRSMCSFAGGSTPKDVRWF